MAQIAFDDLENGLIPDASDFNDRFNALKNRINNGMEVDNLADGAVNLASTKVGGNLPVTKLGSGAGAGITTFWRGDASWSNGIAEVALTDNPGTADFDTDAALGNFFTITIAGNRTMNTPTNPTANQRCIWRIKQDATGGRVVTCSSDFRIDPNFSTTQILPLSTVGGKMNYVAAIYNADDSKWDILAVSGQF